MEPNGRCGCSGDPASGSVFPVRAKRDCPGGEGVCPREPVCSGGARDGYLETGLEPLLTNRALSCYVRVWGDPIAGLVGTYGRTLPNARSPDPAIAAGFIRTLRRRMRRSGFDLGAVRGADSYPRQSGCGRDASVYAHRLRPFDHRRRPRAFGGEGMGESGSKSYGQAHQVVALDSRRRELASASDAGREAGARAPGFAAHTRRSCAHSGFARGARKPP